MRLGIGPVRVMLKPVEVKAPKVLTRDGREVVLARVTFPVCGVSWITIRRVGGFPETHKD